MWSVECKVYFVRDFANCDNSTQSKRKGRAASFINTAKPETCCDTFEKERLCSFPHRRGKATGEPETLDETCWNIKTSISCEPSSNLCYAFGKKQDFVCWPFGCRTTRSLPLIRPLEITSCLLVPTSKCTDCSLPKDLKSTRLGSVGTITYFQESPPNFLDKGKMPCKSKKEEQSW